MDNKFKVIKYLCGCSYILILDPEKQMLHAYNSKCPEHKKSQKYVTLWCVDCGFKIIASPKAGHRQRRCCDCGKKWQREKTREAWQTKYKGRYKQNGKTRYIKEENPVLTKKGMLNIWFESCRHKFPKVKTPILDKYITEAGMLNASA